MKYTILWKYDYEQNDQRYEKYNQNIKKVVKENNDYSINNMIRVQNFGMVYIW